MSSFVYLGMHDVNNCINKPVGKVVAIKAGYELRTCLLKPITCRNEQVLFLKLVVGQPVVKRFGLYSFPLRVVTVRCS